MTLVDFPLARIAKDEEAAEIRAGVRVDYWTDAEQDACERVGYSRVLAECEAKRRIVESLTSAIAYDDSHGGALVPSTTAGAGRLVLNQLALPYADHPDYQQAWRVTGE